MTKSSCVCVRVYVCAFVLCVCLYCVCLYCVCVCIVCLCFDMRARARACVARDQDFGPVPPVEQPDVAVGVASQRHLAACVSRRSVLNCPLTINLSALTCPFDHKT